MQEHQQHSKLVEIMLISSPAFVLSAIGWLSHMLVSAKEIPEAPRIVGGILFSGFVGWVGCMFLMNTGIAPEVSAPIAAILGASGERGFNYFLTRITGNKDV